jgi:hypothetical protein
LHYRRGEGGEDADEDVGVPREKDADEDIGVPK